MKTITIFASKTRKLHDIARFQYRDIPLFETIARACQHRIDIGADAFIVYAQTPAGFCGKPLYSTERGNV